MGKKKRLSESCTEVELEYIEAKMKGTVSDDYKQQYCNNDYKINIKCKNEAQKKFIQALKDDNKKIIISNAPAGVGKSWLTLAMGLWYLRNDYSKFKQIAIYVPTCEAGHPSMRLGFLPGTKEDKLEPYKIASQMTMIDILHENGNYNCENIVNNLVRNDKIHYDVVGFARGRSFKDTYLIIDEAENLSKQEVLLMLTRIGEGCKCILIGDIEQTDRTDLYKNKDESGLNYAIKKLKNLDFVSVIDFSEEDIVRSKFLTELIHAWNSDDNENKKEE